MRAIIQSDYGGPEQLVLRDVPLPEPGSGEIRVGVLACAVNLSDWEYLTGRPFYARLGGGLRHPKRQVLGSDIVGLVEALGPGVCGFEIGQRVMGDMVMTRGGFAEAACVPSKLLAPVPDSLSDSVASALPQAGGIAVTGTEGLQSGQRFLINGAGGGSGTMALHLAKAKGAHVTAVDNGGKLDWLTRLGADAVIDYRVRDFADGAECWDVILDMVATRGPRQIARVLNAGGRYKAVGGPVGVLLSLLIGGVAWRAVGKSIGVLMVPSGRALTARVAQMAVEGALQPHIEAVLPLEEVPEALRRTGEGAVQGKLVIVP
jgi:NADPH:quinone reductase-like Zn-dependent oxidoreductase